MDVGSSGPQCDYSLSQDMQPGETSEAQAIDGRCFFLEGVKVVSESCLRFLSEDRNQRRTNRALFAGSGDADGATNKDGRSAQKAGSSTTDLVSRTKGGAVILDRSPLMDAMDARKSFSEEELSDLKPFSPILPASID